MDNQQERRLLIDTGWTVGVIESEGWVSLIKQKQRNRDYLRPVIGVKNTDPTILDKVGTILHHHEIGFYRTGKFTGLAKNSPDIPYRKLHEEIHIRGLLRCKSVIEKLLIPYMNSEKIEQVRILKQFIDYRLSATDSSRTPFGEFEWECFKKIQWLNAPIRKRLFLVANESSTTVRQEPIIGYDTVCSEVKTSEVGRNVQPV